ncbi:flagellar biosynthesis anti-sigma factor FlgM [Bdellovibrio svalbardensis]|uniref:Negative regulator of flagellin synthesis n=1 Tax=Bdellovibrio svalbardensis TaxID=2972972 RepID=A0ABT6DLR3_9BACT|nr:flagellar biosynthesis anti-sigma factor FlgM [Bdellovibrio svalbardensis]MDG0817010.1 flagellar biosynthesis anti-sigma factor FlgM [Bdellovibrio svalbardensis]
MKITHNKIGQNLNLTDSGKADKASGIASKATEGAATSKLDALKSAGLGESTKVELSPKAQDAKRIKELAMSAPDVDEAKVAKFRDLIDKGEYKTDAKAIADRMVDEHLEF